MSPQPEGAPRRSRTPSPETQIEDAERLAAADPSSALDLLTELLSPRLRRAHPDLAARGAYLQARLLTAQGDYDGALGAIRSARRDWLTSGHVIEALRTFLGQATVLIELGEYPESVDVSRRLLSRVEQLGPADQVFRRQLRAGAHANLGNAYNLMGEQDAAIDAYDVAANLYAGLGETIKQAEMDANRAIALIHAGMAHRALVELERSHARLEQLGASLAAAKCLLDMASARLMLGQVVVASSLLDRATATFARFQARPELARVEVLRARVLSQIGMSADAHDQARSAADTFQDLAMVHEAAGAEQLAGEMSVELGHLDDATEELATAERLFSASGGTVGQGSIWLAQARVEAAGGRREAARQLAQAALERLQAQGPPVDLARAHLKLCAYTDDLDLARQHLAHADAIVDDLDLASLRLRRSASCASVLRREGDLEGAAQVLREALRDHFEPRADVDAGVRQDPPATRVNTAVNEFLRVLVALDTPSASAEAWQVATVTKAEMLNDFSSGGVRVDRPHASLEDDSAETRWLLLSTLYDEMSRQGSPNDRGDLQRRVRSQEHTLVREAVIGALAENPRRAHAPIRVPESTVLQFHVVDDDVVVFLLRDGGVESRLLPGAALSSAELLRDWRSECSRMRAAVSAGGAEAWRHSVPALDGNLMRSFHQVLIEPIEDLVEGLDGEPVLLVAHQHLYGVPFEALDVRGVPMSERFGLYFCAGFGSPTEPQPTQRSTGEVLLLAVPDEVAPEIAEEARAIAELRPEATVLVGEKATVGELRTRAPGADLVHLACHGEYRSDSPLFSAIRLADRWLTGAETMTLDLRGTMVVLSSCDTGRSSDVDAEPLGFVWSLLVAGARSVVAAKWAVDDSVARVFMTALHSQLRDGVPPRHAVDAARRVVKERYAHPYFWAPFRFICSSGTALFEGSLP